MTTEEKQRELNELGEKVLTGMKRAIRKLVETSAANNRELVIGDKDGNIKSVPAKELLKTLAN
jgi:ATP-dependent RNA circularization protein (DNA/RNA ligase family)